MKNFLFVLGIIIFVSCNSGNKTNTQSEENKPRVAQFVTDSVFVSGMHCDMCVASIEKGVNELEGIETVEVSLNDSVAVVKYDPEQLNTETIENVIVKRGYSIKE